MRVPNKFPDAARMARAQAELGRVEARLKRDALKADVIARIVSDTARNQDVLDRPAVFAALTRDADSMMELARQAGWLAEESHAAGTEMRRAGTLLGSLLNAFQVPPERTKAMPSRETGNGSSARPAREWQKSEELTMDPGPAINVAQLPNVVPADEFSKAMAVTDAAPRQEPAVISGRERTGLHAPFVFPIEPLKTARSFLFIMLALFGAGFFVWSLL